MGKYLILQFKIKDKKDKQNPFSKQPIRILLLRVL